MTRRKLGKYGIEVNPLGLGCMRISAPCSWLDGGTWGFGGPTEDEAIRFLHHAMDAGIELFDTANAYGAGQNEETLGKAFAGRREKVVISTKFGHRIDETTRTLMLTGKSKNPDYYHRANTVPALIRWSCEQSLRRLRTDYIDLFLCHIGTAENGEEMRGVLDDLVEEGKIRSYGWSTDLADRAEIIAKGGHCAAIELKLNVLDSENAALAVCEENGLAALIRGPLGGTMLGGGLLTKSVKDASQNESQGGKLKKQDAVRDVLASDGRTVVQGALCWLWAKSRTAIPIPGFRTHEQLEGIIGTLEHGPLSPEEMSDIESILHTGDV
jgi:aryl-alcohol dehydrogenase-like predicted oxidoreductase